MLNDYSADLNNDGKVNAPDLLLLHDKWFEETFGIDG
jgi:hypothetical protein